jgi:hypothetical protein
MAHGLYLYYLSKYKNSPEPCPQCPNAKSEKVEPNTVPHLLLYRPSGVACTPHARRNICTVPKRSGTAVLDSRVSRGRVWGASTVWGVRVSGLQRKAVDVATPVAGYAHHSSTNTQPWRRYTAAISYSPCVPVANELVTTRVAGRAITVEIECRERREVVLHIIPVQGIAKEHRVVHARTGSSRVLIVGPYSLSQTCQVVKLLAVGLLHPSNVADHASGAQLTVTCGSALLNHHFGCT